MWFSRYETHQQEIYPFLHHYQNNHSNCFLEHVEMPLAEV